MDLVEFTALPKQKEAVRLDERLESWDLRFGRWAIGLALVVPLVGFLLPFLTLEVAEARTWSGMATAFERTHSLWGVPMAALMFGSVFLRRRTPVALRGARVGLLLLALIGFAALGYTMWGIARGAEQLGDTLGQAIVVDFEIGAVVMAIGLSFGIVSAFLAGRGPKPDS